MEKAFPEAKVTGYQSLVTSMENDPKDRHVAAAAVKAGAQVIVTMNLRDLLTKPVRSFEDVVRALGKTVPEFATAVSNHAAAEE